MLMQRLGKYTPDQGMVHPSVDINGAFPSSWGLKVSHNESHIRGTGSVAFQPSLAHHDHVMGVWEGGDAVATII